MLRRSASLQYWIIERRSARSNHAAVPLKVASCCSCLGRSGRTVSHPHQVDRTKRQRSLVTPSLAKALMESAKFYHRRQRWYITVFMLMPDHVHALLSFERDESMSRVIGDWKHYQTVQHGIAWQEDYFDHRLRDDERGEQLSDKMNYIRQNPVAAGLCPNAEDWLWWIERSALNAGVRARPESD